MRRRLVLISVGVVVLGFIAAFLTAIPLVETQYQQEFSRRLDAALSLMMNDVRKAQQDPQAFALEESGALRSAGQDIRITVIDLAGKVTGDSHGALSEEKDLFTQNHLSRPEIQQALKEGRGYDARQSESVGESYYYAAWLVDDTFFVRAALSMEELHAAMNQMKLAMALGIALGGVVALVIALISSRRLAQPLVGLTDAAKKIAAGDFSGSVREDYREEVGDLARAFNRMADTTRRAIAELQNEKSQLSAVLQGMGDGVLAVDDHNRVLLLNDSAKKLLECKTLSEGRRLSGSMALSLLGELLSRAKEQNGPVRETMRVAGSKEHLLNVYAAPLCGQQTDIGVLAVLSDVTEMRRLQQLRSEFVANVTHELKTPLTSIRGFIELLKSSDRDEETRQYCYDVLDIEAERLHHLIDDMLVLSQIENAKEESSASRCDLTEEIGHSVERMALLAQKQGIAIHFEKGEPLFAACSPTRMQQLWSNLIENAIKYNKPQGEIFVTAQKQGKTAIVKVRDTGIGIPKEHLPRLFERFYRVDTSRSREIGGTGLGLSIVKHLAGLYHGDVSVESEVGVGSTFTVRLPLIPDTPAVTAAPGTLAADKPRT